MTFFIQIKEVLSPKFIWDRTSSVEPIFTFFDRVTLTVSPVSLIKKLFDAFPTLYVCLLLVVGFGDFVGSTFVLRFDSKPAKQIRNLSFQRIKHVYQLRFWDILVLWTWFSKPNKKSHVSLLYSCNLCHHKRDHHLFFRDIFDKTPIFLSKWPNYHQFHSFHKNHTILQCILFLNFLRIFLQLDYTIG